MTTTRPSLEADFLGDPTPARSSAPTAASPGAAADTRIRAVTVYLPIPLHAAVLDTTHRRGLSITALTYEAFTAHGANFHALTPTPQPGAMPTRTPQRRRGLGTVQVQLRLSNEQVAWLDNHVASHGAPSRSALVTAVLSKHLNV